MVEPKRQKLRQAQDQLEAANVALAEKQASLRGVVERVEGLRRQLAEAQAEQKRLNEQVGAQAGIWDGLVGVCHLWFLHVIWGCLRCNRHPGRPHNQAP